MYKFLFYITKNTNKLHILLVNDSNLNILGYMYLTRISNDTWDVKSVAAINKKGVLMHDAAMDLVYPDFIISTRDGQIVEKEINIFKKYIDREDVEHQSIDNLNYDWSNLKFRLKKKINIPFENGNITIKYMGIKFFNKLYNFKS